MNKKYLIVSLVVLGGGMLGCFGQPAGVQVADAAPKPFDRSRLIPLEKSIPVEAMAAKPDYSKRKPAALPKVNYRVVHESSVGGGSFADVGTGNLQAALMQRQTANSLLSNTDPLAYYEYIAPDGQKIYLPLQSLTQAQSKTFFVAPSRATYRIIERVVEEE